MHDEVLPATQRAWPDWGRLRMPWGFIWRVAPPWPSTSATGSPSISIGSRVPFPWPAYGCRLASLDDLAAMKLLAVAQRGTKKDFIDVDAISASIDLAEMLDCYRRKFSVSDVGRVLAGLTYFDDAESEPMPTMLVPTSWDAVKERMRDRVRQFAGP